MSSSSEEKLSVLKAVIFDYGDVLCLPPGAEEVEASARIFDISADLFRVLWSRHRDEYDRGDLSPEEYWRKFADEAGKAIDADQLHELDQRDMAMWSHPNPAMVAWLENLSTTGMKTAVLSNMHAGMIQHVRGNFRWLDRVNWTTFSAEVRLIKPQPEIYEHCLQGLAVAPSESLFIDDRDVNLAAARAMGIHGIQYKSMIQLRGQLEAAGFPTLPLDSQAHIGAVKSDRSASG